MNTPPYKLLITRIADKVRLPFSLETIFQLLQIITGFAIEI